MKSACKPFLCFLLVATAVFIFIEALVYVYSDSPGSSDQEVAERRLFTPQKYNQVEIVTLEPPVTTPPPTKGPSKKQKKPQKPRKNSKKPKKKKPKARSKVGSPTEKPKDTLPAEALTESVTPPTTPTTEVPVTTVNYNVTDPTAAPTDPPVPLPDNLIPFKNAGSKTNVRNELQGQAIHLDTCHTIFTPELDKTNTTTAVDSAPLNIAFIFTGRWFFLRIQLPQIIRELRQNGGIIDKVWFILIQWTPEDYSKLKEFAKVANRVLKEEVFVFHNYQDYNIHMKKPYTYAYCEILANLLKYPSNRYFKIDDDVVYIHPKAFDRVVDNKIKQKPNCLLNLFNTAGGNWMCNRIYQDNGVLDEVDNPDNIDFHKVGGEGKVTSTSYALNVFLQFQKSNHLEKLFIGPIPWNKRYTMNAAMFDADTFDFELVKKAGSLKHDKDEPWWTNTYPVPGDRFNCLTGDTVIVHFSHAGGGLAKKIIDLGFLDKFEDIVKEQRKDGIIKMEDELWEVLEYS